MLSFMVKLYIKCISPYMRHRCRFYPSCSNYALEIIHTEGWRSIHKIIIRILKCNPFYKV